MTHLKPGDPAPDFEGIDQNNEIVRLSDFKGKKLVLYFYPKDMTPGCTMEAKSLRDAYDQLRAKGYEVVGVSPDPVARHQKFVAKYELPFRLLADEDKTIAKAYGVWGKKKFMGREFMGILRTTFLIEDGIIKHVITKVKTKEHAAQILAV